MSGKPVIFWNNYLPDAAALAVVEGSEAVLAGFGVDNLASPFTYTADSFMFEHDSSTTGVIRFRTGLVESGANAFGFICLGLSSTDITIRSSSTEGGTYSDITTVQVDRDGVFMVKIAVQTNQYFEVEIEASSTDFNATAIMPNMFIGQYMEFEKCIMRKYAPLDYNRATEFLTNESGRGSFMGRSIIRRNYESSVSFDLMSAPWSRSTFQPFVRHARTKPYYFAWNLDTYPDEANYVWTDEDIGIEYTGDRNMMSASWSMRGLGNGE